MRRPPPTWHKGKSRDTSNKTEDDIIKAIINPSSPFIVLPQKLFGQIAEDWLQSFPADQKPYCTESVCIAMSACSKIRYLKDFGLRLGSLRDTHDHQDGRSEEDHHDDDLRQNIVHRGAREVEYHKQDPQFFRIPYQSYLVDGDKMGLEHDVCYLAITGYIPDEEGFAVLGQPFL